MALHMDNETLATGLLVKVCKALEPQSFIKSIRAIDALLAENFRIWTLKILIFRYTWLYWKPEMILKNLKYAVQLL